ncbi:hypothetical protein AG0111_0g12058 [Alternaria gaisen]|uniref:Uncharacterized protein n=1 Tax=Alternaria gaisen TaxID=167740 RepID=A0ACB6F573_9PLEO|nr:hypothetical protein AG0111_0g12058 [Alternaria gaisen]
MRAVVEGPYGNELPLDSYGTVLLFATGIGIAGQLPYVTQLLEGYLNCKVKTRRIALFWEVESERHTAWVADRMQELLKQDTGRILDIHLFVVSNFISAKTQKGHYEPLGERIDILYDAMDPESLISSEIQDRKGRTVVSFCTDNETSIKIRRAARKMLDKNIYLEELDFRPGRETRRGGAKARLNPGKGKRRAKGV